MKTIRIPGKNNVHKVLLYAISTCGWCKKTKKFLTDIDVEYEYVDVDLCNQDDRREIQEDILGRGGRLSYPTVIIDDKTIISGFHEDQIKDALKS